jgi:hypothetical protein
MYALLFQDDEKQVSPLTQYNESSLNGDRNAFSRLKRRLADVYIFITGQLLARAMSTHGASHWF